MSLSQRVFSLNTASAAIVSMTVLGCSGQSTSVPGSGSTVGGYSSGSSSGGSSNAGGASNAGGTTSTGGASAGPTGLPSSCSGSCDAATPANPTTTAYGTLGNVTVYSTSASSNGACGYGSTSVMYYAAIDSSMEWNGGHICGQCMQVTLLTSQGEKSVVVRIMDECPDNDCGIDFGGSASGAVMVDGAGRYEGAWRSVSCVGQTGVSDGSPSLYVKDGASSGWSIVQVRNPNAAVTSIDWQNASNSSSSGTLAWATEAENYYSIPTSILGANASFVFTIHYSDGTTSTVTLTSAQLSQPSTSYPLN